MHMSQVTETLLTTLVDRPDIIILLFDTRIQINQFIRTKSFKIKNEDQSIKDNKSKSNGVY